MTTPSRRKANRIAREARIKDAALTTFAQSGYAGTSMDTIAAAAGISKPTLYQYFASKEELFTAVMHARRDDMLLAFEQPDPDRMPQQLFEFAWRYADTILRSDLLSLARLIIGEAQRFPEIGRAYQASGPDRVLEGIMRYFDAQRTAGRLTFEDAELAAQDFWGLILSAPRNRALYEPSNPPTKDDCARYIENGLRVFLKAYSTKSEQDIKALTQLL
jgi:TetR/AcrR family transcriptional repressor of mexJK operon